MQAKYTIGRHPEGITINPKEYVLNDSNEVREFTLEELFNFLSENFGLHIDQAGETKDSKNVQGELMFALKQLVQHPALEMCYREDLPLDMSDPDCIAAVEAIQLIEPDFHEKLYNKSNRED